MREKKTKKVKIGNIVIKDMKKFITAIIIFVILIIIICVIVGNISNNGSKDTSLSSLDAKKNVSELASKYENEGMQENFIKDYNEIQSKVGIYMMNNITTDSNSFNNTIKEINNILKSENWEKMSITKNNTWNGVWSLDSEGNLKFKFSLKAIEPSWINASDIKSKIIFN